MTVHFETIHPAQRYADVFGVLAPDNRPVGRELWPRQPGAFVRLRQDPVAPALALQVGQFGLVPRCVGADGAEIVSFTLLTVNANSHALMHRYQQPGAEKRMPAILNEGGNEGGYRAWLHAGHPEKAREFLRAHPANWLTANPVQKK